MIQVIQQQQLFDLSMSKVTLFRSENLSSLQFDLFPIPERERLVSSLGEIEVIASQSPQRSVTVSRSTLDVRSTAPISTQVSAKKQETSKIAPASEQDATLGSLLIQKPRLVSRQFSVKKDETIGSSETILVYQTLNGSSSDVTSESSLLSTNSVSTSFSTSQAVGTIERSLVSKKCIPIKIDLEDFTLDSQQVFIAVKCKINGRLISSQQFTVTNLEILDSEQLDLSIKTIRYTRIDAGNLQFTAYLNKRSEGSSVLFTCRTWSNSVLNSEFTRSLQQIGRSSRSATFSTICTQNQYVEVIAQVIDSKNRLCGYPARSLVKPRNSIVDIQSIVLKGLDSSGLSASVLGIPSGTDSIRITRQNIANLALPAEEVGVFPVIGGTVDFRDKDLVEENYPGSTSSFEYEVLLIIKGVQKKSDHVLRVDYSLIDNSYSFDTRFAESAGQISVQITPEKPKNILDGLSTSLAERALTDSFADQIKEIRSQTSESFLYDAYSINLETSEQQYLGEFADNQFSLPLRRNSIYYLYPKTSTPRKQISAIKQQLQQPQLISRSRGSRVNPRNLAANLDSQSITDDGIRPRLFNPSALIDGTLSTRDSALNSYLTGQVIVYQPLPPRTSRQTENLRCKRIYRERNLIQWSCPSGNNISHFLLSATLGDSNTQGSLRLCAIQKSQATQYSFIDEVFGKSPGFIRYYLTPVSSSGEEQTTLSVDLQPGEVEIG